LKIDHTTGSAIPLPLAGRPRTGSTPAPAVSPRPADAAACASNVHPFPGTDDGTFDAARVAAIREEIRSGRYQVNPERIADGMLASVRELLEGGKP
jgi:negative regulator of flagellin synthesis FlgM